MGRFQIGANVHANWSWRRQDRRRVDGYVVSGMAIVMVS